MKNYFESYAVTGNEFLAQLARNLNAEGDLDKAARVLRSVFRAFRQHIPMQESLHLIAQLPMAIKSMYVDGWKYVERPLRIKHVSDLVSEVMVMDGNRAFNDFRNEAGARHAIRQVFRSINHYVRGNELEDVGGTLSKELQEFLKGVLEEDKAVI